MECGMTTVTMGRQKEVDFSNLIFVDGGNVLLREDTTLRRTADLAGRKIAVQGGTTTEQVLRRGAQAAARGRRGGRREDTGGGPGDGRGRHGGRACRRPDRCSSSSRSGPRSRTSCRCSSRTTRTSRTPSRCRAATADLRLVVNRELARLFRSGDISEVMNHWFGALGGPSLLLTAMVYLNSIPE